MLTDKTSVARVLGRMSKAEVQRVTDDYQRMYMQPLSLSLSQGLSTTPNLLKAIKAFVFEVRHILVLALDRFLLWMR